jgi:hypothetical protein
MSNLIWAVLLSAVTFIFGAVPLLGLRRTAGRKSFWLGTLIGAVVLSLVGLTPVALAVSTLAVLVGIYVELDEMETPLFYSLLGSVVGAIGYLGLAIGGWFYATKTMFVPAIKQWIDRVLQQSQSFQAGLNLQPEAIFNQLPSIVVIALLISLVLAVSISPGDLTERNATVRSRLTAYYVPDWGIWFMCAALLASFSPNRPEVVEVIGVNLLNVLVVFYFLQGLSVTAKLFAIYKVGVGWQVFWYFLLTLQMFIVVAILGFVDYWLDVRRWISKKMTETN